MKVNWRNIKWARNSYAVLYAACEKNNITLNPVDHPEDDVTLYSLNSINAGQYLDEMKDAGCITIAGGPHPSARYEDILNYADYVIVGEGEHTLPALLKAIENNSPVLPRGVATKGQYIKCDKCVFLDAYEPFTRVKGYIEVSRGCPFGCGYCQTPRLFGGHMRHRSIDAIVRASEAYSDVRFLTPNALSYGSRDGRKPAFEKLKKLLGSFDRDKNLYLGTFPSEVRPEFVTDESAEIIVDFCKNKKLHFGAQSGSERVLKAINRGHTTEDVINAVEKCKDYGIFPIVDYIVGLPGETKEDQKETIEQIKWVCRFGKVHAHYFTPLPGTPLADEKPAPLIPEIEKTLGRLSLAGRATGSWMNAELRFFTKNKNQ
ncbi:TIGR04013 family B12-binding domain/radical SAM domain-containing protein [Methanoplanus sp. FWC-SCC4]|uniref:TIGR04013 family B12-binding domain/radical SAM domain-containing protein n=1 Tax=Methanochimaera problematica TaxID=2609417 RepID=A0AA97I3U1_9EURY|nr:TIGR04013 family B12-binding domain/radical SAM domain-containing protein [Methanoplanus sp. FWC-SCC4]WOF15601.1 TIGR04013 family B12-binding domain/radical SAM domain-containing protein [Methanoplanus sp. FWC-SCC4]